MIIKDDSNWPSNIDIQGVSQRTHFLGKSCILGPNIGQFSISIPVLENSGSEDFKTDLESENPSRNGWEKRG